MTRETYYLGAYWGARAESPEQISERVSATMLQFAQQHELLTRWNERADTLDEAAQRMVEPVPRTIGPLLTALEPDDPPAFGYSLSLWNGRLLPDERCTFDVLAGMAPSSSWASNHLVLNFTRDPECVASLYQPEVLLQLLISVVRIWEPDHARVTSIHYDSRHALPEDGLPMPGQPRVGWMTYLQAGRLEQLSSQHPCRTVEVGAKGTIFVVTDEHRFTVENPDDVARTHALADYLGTHGALRRLPTHALN